MHFQTYVVINHKELPEDYDSDDIQSAVQELLEPEMNKMWDWYSIGGAWNNEWKNNMISVHDFIENEADMPEKYFDYQGETLDIDEYIGLPYRMGWKHDCDEYKNLQKKIKESMLKAIKHCHPNDIIVMVDLHN